MTSPSDVNPNAPSFTRDYMLAQSVKWWAPVVRRKCARLRAETKSLILTGLEETARRVADAGDPAVDASDVMHVLHIVQEGLR